jgi:hypothetical protein
VSTIPETRGQLDLEVYGRPLFGLVSPGVTVNVACCPLSLHGMGIWLELRPALSPTTAPAAVGNGERRSAVQRGSGLGDYQAGD